MGKTRRTIAKWTAASLLLSQMAFAPPAAAAPMNAELVQDGTFAVNVYELGFEENVVGKPNDPSLQYNRTAIQFRLPPANGQVVANATLRLHITAVDRNGVVPEPFLEVYGSDEDNWSDTIPAHGGAPLDSVFGDAIQPEHSIAFDVTSYVAGQASNGVNDLVTFVLRANETFGGPNDSLQILIPSDEYYDALKHPELELTYADAVTASKAPAPITAETAEDNDAEGIKVLPNSTDGTAVTHFKITEITGGKLYLKDGATEVADGAFITAAQGSEGLKFTPNGDANDGAGGPFAFKAQAVQDASGKGLSPAATAAIAVSEVNDKPVPQNDQLAPIEQDSGVRSIPFASLLANDSAGPVNESGQTLTVQAVRTDPSVGSVTRSGTNVLFAPAPGYHGPASFEYRIEDNGTTDGNDDAQISDTWAIAAFDIEARADRPSIAPGAETAEDTMSSAVLVISPGTGGGAPTNYYKITGIAGGTLYHSNGTAPIADGTFITAWEAGAGLRFLPAPDGYGTTGFGFIAQASPAADGTKLSETAAAAITVTEVNDPPVAGDDVLADILEDAAPLRIPFASLLGNDNAGAGESGQTLTIAPGAATGGQAAVDGEDIVFTPEPNYHGAAGFAYELRDNGTTNGLTVEETDEGAVSFAILSIADVPAVTDAETDEDTQSSSGLVITRNDADGTDVDYFKITGIHGGTLFLNEGATPIANGGYIEVEEGEKGLKFTPSLHANSDAGDTFGFYVQAARDMSGSGLSEAATVAIIVHAVNDAPLPQDDALDPIAENSGPRTIPIASLLANDSPGADNEDETLAMTAVGAASSGGHVTIVGTNVVYTPMPGYRGTESFEYTVQDGEGVTNQGTVTFQVLPLAAVPSVTEAETPEDTMTASGLVIAPSASSDTPTTHYIVTDIAGGRLFLQNGTSEIRSGDVITKAEGAAGLRFLPDADMHGNTGFGFRVQAAADAGGSLASAAVEAVVTVTEVNDAPTAANDRLPLVAPGTEVVSIPFSDLAANDIAGPPDEVSWQSLIVTDATAVAGGTVAIAGGRVEFRPDPAFVGLAKFTYTINDNGRTDGQDAYKSSTAEASFYVRDENPPVIALHGDETVYLLRGASFFEPGYSAHDAGAPDGGDLSGRVRVDGSVDTLALGTYVLRYNVRDEAGNAAAERVRTVKVVSHELADLEVDGLALTPAFSPGGAAYTLRVPSGQADVTVTANALDPTATVTINGVAVGSGGSRELALRTGTNAATVIVTAQGGSTKTYTVTIARPAQPTLTLNGDATVFVPQGGAFAEPGFAAADGAGQDLTDGVAVTGAVDTLTLGTYTLRYNVSDAAGNAAPERVRTVRVVSDALGALTVDGQVVPPAFEAGRLSYELQVGHGKANAVVAAAAADPTAAITVNGESKGGGGTHDMTLNVGRNTVTIDVTALGGSTRTYTLVIVRAPAPQPVPEPAPEPAPQPAPQPAPEPAPQPAAETPAPVTRQAKVVAGAEANVVQVDVTRTVSESGLAVDAVALQGAKVDEVVAKAKADGTGIPRIVVDDLPEQPADEVEINVPGEALGKLRTAGLGLAIEAGGARITLPADTMDRLGGDGNELFFRVVPIRKAEQTEQVRERVLNAEELQAYANGQNVQAVGRPMTIETNYSNRSTKVMFPLAGIELPSGSRQRAAYLDSLAVFVEHGDGDKEVENGEIVFDEAGTPVGIEIEIQKFSTFTIVSTDGGYTAYARYITGYPDGLFHPDAPVTRAEIAAILARVLDLDGAAASVVYKDMTQAHWAAEAVLRLTAADLLSGDPDGRFRPGDGVSRAEMALVVARAKKLDGKAGGSAGTAFADVPQGHWAAAAIAAAEEAGLMFGNGEGLFEPARLLTRAEAVAVLNRLFERPALNDTAVGWYDVEASSWAAGDIASASRDFRVYADGKVEISE